MYKDQKAFSFFCSSFVGPIMYFKFKKMFCLHFPKCVVRKKLIKKENFGLPLVIIIYFLLGVHVWLELEKSIASRGS